MATCFVIEYRSHDKDYVSQQVVAVCATLDRALWWLIDEQRGKSWSNRSYIEGFGLNARLITDFAEDGWTECVISQRELLD